MKMCGGRRRLEMVMDNFRDPTKERIPPAHLFNQTENEMEQPTITVDRLLDALLCCEHIAIHQEDLPKNLKTDKERELHDALNKIYRICHTARVPSCFDKHIGWEMEFQEYIEISNA